VSGHADEAASLYARVLKEHRDVERIAGKARRALAEMGDLPVAAKEALSGYDGFLQKRDQQLTEWRATAVDDAQKTLERAEGHELRARHREAQSVLAELVGRAPGFLPARMKLAEVDLALGLLGEAADQYRTILLIDPTSDDARVNLARVLFRSDVGLPEAVEHLQAVKDNFWNAKEAKFLLGGALLRQDDYEGALWAFTKARELGYNFWACLQAVQDAKWGFDVDYYMESGRYDEALKLYSAIEQAFSKQFGGNPYYALKSARIYIEKSDFDEARKALARVDAVARFDPEHAQHAQEAQGLLREIDRLAKEGRRPAPPPSRHRCRGRLPGRQRTGGPRGPTGRRPARRHGTGPDPGLRTAGAGTEPDRTGEPGAGPCRSGAHPGRALGNRGPHPG
jgi:tetratricopeptide (TPR) repeat protein